MQGLILLTKTTTVFAITGRTIEITRSGEKISLTKTMTESVIIAGTIMEIAIVAKQRQRIVVVMETDGDMGLAVAQEMVIATGMEGKTTLFL